MKKIDKVIKEAGLIGVDKESAIRAWKSWVAYKKAKQLKQKN